MKRTVTAIAALIGAGLLATPASADMDAAKALVAKHREAPTFDAPGKPFDAKACMADKKMFVIPLTSANPFNAEISRGMKPGCRHDRLSSCANGKTS